VVWNDRMTGRKAVSRRTALVGSIVVSVALLAVTVVSGESEGPGSPATGADAADSGLEPIELRYLAVLPPINRSGRAIPAEEIRQRLALRLGLLRGIDVLDHDKLDRFMRRHRMRFTGGLNSELARLLDVETNSWGVLITSVDLYSDETNPALALTCRLVTTEAEPRILWMDSAVRTGDQSPGAFDLGLVSDPAVIVDDVASQVVMSLPRGEGGPEDSPKRKRAKIRKFKPRVFYSSPDLSVIRREDARIVVLPFTNDSGSNYVGEIVSDQLVRQLVALDVAVIEPGVVRQALLEARQVYPEGPSIPETDILRASLNADVVVYGEVENYKEQGPINAEPYVEFLVHAMDAERGQVIWSSASYGGGNKGVFFFGLGHVPTAHQLASRMVAALIWAVDRADQSNRKRR